LIETFADGFSGIGGFRKPLEDLGLKCTWSCDWSRAANYIYYKRFAPKKGEHNPGDIRRVNPEEIPDFDLFCAGFPCPSFSVAGPRNGFNDKRGEVFFEIPRIAKVKRPKMLLLENVPGLLSHDEGKTFATILNSLGELGYLLEWQILNSKHFGVPQNRERVFIIGHLRGGGSSPLFPISSDGYKTDKKLRKIGNIAETGHDSIWGRVYDPEGIAMSLNAEAGGLGAKTGLYAIPEVANTLDQDGYLRIGKRPRDENGKPQLLPLGYRRIRKLTPIECERLQGFPDNWTEGLSYRDRIRVLGKAVTTNVVKYLGELILAGFTNKEAENGV